MSTWKLSSSASDHLNLIRGTAAIAVAAGHFRGLFFVDYEHAHVHNLVTKALYFFTGFGHQAVVVFFVLSGFLVSATVLKHTPLTWSPSSYAANRLTRLYIVLVPALAVTALCDAIGHRLPGGPVFYYAPIPHFSVVPFAFRYNATAFAGTLAFCKLFTCLRLDRTDRSGALRMSFGITCSGLCCL
jgi:peptidoglycan/LPS O-acetylase OafA/YrhL